MTTNKEIASIVRNLLRDELKTQLGAKFITGFDTKHVGATRNLRAGQEDPKPLLFTGNAYVIIATRKAEAKFADGTVRELSTQMVRTAWEKVVQDNFPDNRIAIDGEDHILLDPTFDNKGRVLFGFTGLKVPSFAPLPVPPQFKSAA